MEAHKWTLEGYEFTSSSEFEKAKKEREAIDYIKTNTDLTNLKTAYQVYQKLISKDTFHTELGIDFLKELRSLILRSSYVPEDQISPLPTIKEDIEETTNTKLSSNQQPLLTQSKFQTLVQKQAVLRNQLTRSRIVNIFLVIIILAMFIITLTSKNSPYVDHETKLLDKYSSWSEDLTKKQKELLEKESQLNQKEMELNQKEAQIQSSIPNEDE